MHNKHVHLFHKYREVVGIIRDLQKHSFSCRHVEYAKRQRRVAASPQGGSYAYLYEVVKNNVKT